MIANATKLCAHLIEKPWGRTVLPRAFGEAGDHRIGEIRFEGPADDDLPLLVKYLFTSDHLSVQVHPDDEQARSRGLPRGKTECWYVLDAIEGATIGYGLKSSHSKEELRQAALAGTIEELLDWKHVRAGDFLYVPGGIIHAIGAGITLLELQQNSDTTYRLYDYGRARALHVDEGVSVSSCTPPTTKIRVTKDEPRDIILLDGPHFSVVRATHSGAVPQELNQRYRWVIPLAGQAGAGPNSARAGECLLLPPGAPLLFSPDALVLVAAEGSIGQAAA
jgi:mannose-6-phosphate isomerase